MENKNIHIVVGLSGGVDSAVALHLLKEKGYKVTALIMKNWNPILANEESFFTDNEFCPWPSDLEDAIEITDKLKIKLVQVNFVQEYWDLVFKKMIKEYKEGLTPNPDIFCNRDIKFDLMLKYAKDVLKADKIATGHYAKILKVNNKYTLGIAKDTIKDQTYFLSGIRGEVLKDVIFPLGNLLKSEVRKIAQEKNLSVANKKDSTGICFIGERNFERFLENYIKKNPGDIKDIITNKVIGRHNGINFYTIGQRKGLNLGGQESAKYVCKKDYDNNIIFVTDIQDKNNLWTNKLIAINFNNLNDIKKGELLKAKVKIRHSNKYYDANIMVLKNNILEVNFFENQKAITPGQWCAAYIDNICIGSGQII